MTAEKPHYQQIAESAAPTIRVLSLGAGVQSTTLLLLAAEGKLPKPDAAIFADTEWEPQGVYDHLARLERDVAIPADIPILRVSRGNLREDVLSSGRIQIPLFVKTDTERGGGINGRACTQDYKVGPIKKAIRDLLGYPSPKAVPSGIYAEQWIGISADEVQRAKDTDVRYTRNVFPLLDLGWTRKDCVRYLEVNGWGSTPKSACIGCPFHGNRAWRDLRDNHPDEWADAVDFDRRVREESPHRLRGVPFLHRSLVPLDEAPIDRVTRAEWGDAQSDIFDALHDVEMDEPDGCSPFTCRSDTFEPLAEDGDAA